MQGENELITGIYNWVPTMLELVLVWFSAMPPQNIEGILEHQSVTILSLTNLPFMVLKAKTEVTRSQAHALSNHMRNMFSKHIIDSNITKSLKKSPMLDSYYRIEDPDNHSNMWTSRSTITTLEAR